MAKKCPKCKADNPDNSRFCADCGTQLPSLEELEVTKTIEAPKEELTRGTTFAGRYEIIEELGKGGMGRVYRVEDTKAKEEIALKLIKPEIATDKKTIERFRNELTTARKIAHRNVCRMYDLGEERGRHYITMEYISGQDLKGIIHQMGQLTVGKAVSIAKQICDGLTEAHSLGVVHRDLKPNNIMIDKGGNAKIMDFGIARAMKGKSITGAGVVIGTPQYMSPEQVEGKDIDQRSDVYSLGIILYEMLTNRVPFEGDTPLIVGVKQKTETPKDPKDFNPQIPDGLNRVILKCLEKDKENRYQSADEIKFELEKIEKGLPAIDRVIPQKKTLTSKEITVSFSVKKLLLPALLFVAALTTVFLIWSPWKKEKAVPAPTDKPSIAILNFKNSTGDKNLEHWREGLSIMLTTDLSQSKYIHVLSSVQTYGVLKRTNLIETVNYSPQDLEKIAKQGGVNNLLTGSYAKAGDTFLINISLFSMDTGEFLSSFEEQGENEDSIPGMVDSITKKVKLALNISRMKVADDSDKKAEEVTTSSPEAFKFYIEGRKFHNRAEFKESIRLMHEAIEIDPGFAMAYRSIGSSYQNAGFQDEGNKYYQKALEFADRLTERERLQIQGDVYGASGIYDEAEKAYKQILKLYPDDVLANHQLGSVYWTLENIDKAIESYEKVVQAKSDISFTFLLLANIYSMKGLHDKARETLQLYLDNFGESPVIRGGLALVLFREGKFELALEEIDKALYLSPSLHNLTEFKGDIYVYKGDIAKAELEYQKLLVKDNPVSYGSGLRRLSNLYLIQGRYEDSKLKLGELLGLAEESGRNLWIVEAHRLAASLELLIGNPELSLKMLGRAWEITAKDKDLSWQRTILHDKGLVYLKMGSLDMALNSADELNVVLEKEVNKKLMRNYYHLMGRIELEKKNFSEAIAYFSKMYSLSPYSPVQTDILFIHSFATAYFEAGELEKAKTEYEKIISLKTGRDDNYARSFYMLGKIYEEQDDEVKAIEHYEKFLTLWKDADPGIAEVEDARKRLAVLRTQLPMPPSL